MLHGAETRKGENCWRKRRLSSKGLSFRSRAEKEKEGCLERQAESSALFLGSLGPKGTTQFKKKKGEIGGNIIVKLGRTGTYREEVGQRKPLITKFKRTCVSRWLKSRRKSKNAYVECEV